MVSLGQTMDFLTAMMIVLFFYNIHSLHLIRTIADLKRKRDELHAQVFANDMAVPEKYQRSKDNVDAKIAFDRKMEKVMLVFSYVSIFVYLGVYKFSH